MQAERSEEAYYHFAMDYYARSSGSDAPLTINPASGRLEAMSDAKSSSSNAPLTTSSDVRRLESLAAQVAAYARAEEKMRGATARERRLTTDCEDYTYDEPDSCLQPSARVPAHIHSAFAQIFGNHFRRAQDLKERFRLLEQTRGPENREGQRHALSQGDEVVLDGKGVDWEAMFRRVVEFGGRLSLSTPALHTQSSSSGSQPPAVRRVVVPLPTSLASAPRSRATASVACRDFAAGRCKYGERCRFDHSEAGVASCRAASAAAESQENQEPLSYAGRRLKRRVDKGSAARQASANKGNTLDQGRSLCGTTNARDLSSASESSERGCASTLGSREEEAREEDWCPPIEELDDPFEEYSAANYSENFREERVSEEEPEFRECVPQGLAVLENQYEEYRSPNRFPVDETAKTPAARPPVWRPAPLRPQGGTDRG